MVPVILVPFGSRLVRGREFQVNDAASAGAEISVADRARLTTAIPLAIFFTFTPIGLMF
jgi:hypothetical protein